MTTMRRRGAALAIAIAVAWVPACGGASKSENAPAKAPTSAPAPELQDTTRSTETAPAGSTVVPPPSAGGEREELWTDLDRAEQQLSASASDCSAACRALASMERATQQLCTLGELPEDKRRCDDAKGRLRSARDRVRATCTECTGGPSVERDAPPAGAP